LEQLSFFVLGSFRVHVGEENVTGAFRTKKERALLAYLAVEAQKRHRREALAEPG
jgi:DNA-binding SARP family transcriptional activator